MRIVIATHDAERHYFFCNRLVENTGNVVGVITGGKVVRRSRREEIRRLIRKRNGLFVVRNKLLNLLYRDAGRAFWREKAATEDRYFGGSRDHFLAHHGNLQVAHVSKEHRSINDPFFIEALKRLRPDVIAVMGTCMLGRRFISASPHVFNMHTGLSPYYRGGQSNLWPILEGDHGHFGVTVHEMSLGIDSGDIIFTRRPDVEEDDTYADINSKSIILGTELMVEAIRRLEAGTIDPVAQWTAGKLFYNRDMNHHVAHRYFKKRRTFMATYARLERDRRLPDVRLIGT